MRCLDSIILQNFQDYEILLIDGLSQDTTLETIKKYANRYPFIHFTSEKDKGIYDAMNKGIKMASGEWLYFLGSDDSLFKDSVLLEVAEGVKKSNSKIIYGNVLMKGQSRWNLDGQIFAGEYNLERILNLNICHQAIFYNKLVFERHGFYNLKYHVGADWDFNLRCFADTSFSYINTVIANYCLEGYSSSSNDTEFSKNRGAIYFNNFKHRIFNKSFLNSRLYLHQAAFSLNSPLSLPKRIFCLVAYIKLKIQALLTNKKAKFMLYD
jgi:glycosyltransferase involved in cell wall biosynthesis